MIANYSDFIQVFFEIDYSKATSSDIKQIMRIQPQSFQTIQRNQVKPGEQNPGPIFGHGKRTINNFQKWTTRSAQGVI